jgi:Ala-tRNA(Pro) deacylase
VTGLPCKNLFLKAKKERAPGDSRLWLVVAPASAKTDLNAIGKTLGYPKDGVRFGDEETLKDNLGVVPGHVSPLCLFNDKAGLVNVVLDSSLTISTLPLLFHPFTNTASIEMTYAQLLDLLTKLGKKPVIMDFPTA